MPKFPLFRALSHRNFRLFFFGQGLSLIGTWLQQVAMSWLTYRLSESALLLGFVTFCQYIAVLYALTQMRWPVVRVHAPSAGWLASWLEGAKSAFVFRPIRAALLLIALISGTIGTYSTLMPIFAKDVFGGDAHTLGLLRSAAGSGALLSALYLASRHTTRGLDRVVLVAGTTAALAMLAFAHAPRLALALPLLVALGAGLIAAQASIQTLVQTLVDDDKRGRVMSLYTMAFLGMLPFGNLAAGAVARYSGEATAFTLNACLCLAGLVVFGRALPGLRMAAQSRKNMEAGT